MAARATRSISTPGAYAAREPAVLGMTEETGTRLLHRPLRWASEPTKFFIAATVSTS